MNAQKQCYDPIKTHARYTKPRYVFASKGFKTAKGALFDFARVMDHTPARQAAGVFHATGCGQHSLPSSSIGPPFTTLLGASCSAAAMRRFSHYLTAATEERVNVQEARLMIAFPDK